jgi:hypothetical protein
MAILPGILAYTPNSIAGWINSLYLISLTAVFFVMIIRPLSDLFPELTWLRTLVILRKGVGVLSASIIVSFILSKILLGGTDYVENFFTSDYWSIVGWSFLAHTGDVTAVILIVTSNKFSKRILGKNWKRIQKLAYVYFYAGAGYEMLALGSTYAFIAIIAVTILIGLAHIKNSIKLT